MRFLFTVFVTAVLVGGFGLLYIYSGAYNVAATAPQDGTARWLLGTVMQKSVEVRARTIEPAPLDDKAIIARGGKFYGANCESCHGGPGVVLSALGRGLRPQAPDLARTVRDWRPRELFWIVKNGIRMTGMPAWGPSHKDAELWPVVAFISKLPTMTVADYQAYTGTSGEGPAVSDAASEDEAADRAARRDDAEAAERAERPTGTASDADRADGATEKAAPDKGARDVAKAEPGPQKSTANGAAKDDAAAANAKAAPSGAARDAANADALTRKDKADGAARDVADAGIDDSASDGAEKKNASPTAPAKQTAQAAAPRIRVHARPQQKPEPPRSSVRRQRR
jgi:mono/diheme cytochrome c family protein